MKFLKKAFAGAAALCISITAAAASGVSGSNTVSGSAAESSVNMEWGSVEIGGGGYVSGIVTGQNEMYLRTDVGGAYKYDYDAGEWVQLLDFLGEDDRGLLSVSGIAIDPTDDDTFYMLCGCAYFSDARTVIFKTTDGGETFTEHDVTDMIQCHANGDGRECSEPIAVDPDNPDIIYAGGDVASGSSCLIKSTDGGETWSSVDGYDDLGMYTNELNWPTWVEHTVRGTSSGAYNNQNGVDTIYIEGGKVYVGSAVTGQANVHVADVDTDEFTVLSEDLPTANYPVTISSDYNGNLFVTYIAGLAFSGSAGGAYKYNTSTGTVTDISPSGSAFGMITADKNDPDKLLARTCGVWSDQWYEKEWTESSIAWGDYFYRSTDGGETWTNITPGQHTTEYTADGAVMHFISEPIDTNGYDWIYGKAIHWGSGILIDPRNSDKILVTSGNGVFACDNVWDETGIQFYFDPKGVEEVVALDMCSVPGGAAYSAIGDYDGYIHTDVNTIGIQYTPNIGSTNSIAYCPQDTSFMVRCSESDAGGYYSTDAGTTWTKMSGSVSSGGKVAIAKIDDDTYRIFKSTKGGVSYSDDLGSTWNSISLSGLYYECTPYPFVDLEDPQNVYIYGYSQPANQWDTTPAAYKLYVSTDGGKTFSSPTDVCTYDYCDAATRIAYLGDGKIVLGGGWYGLYTAEAGGKNITSLNVYYCKTVGYGAPEKEGGVNTLYIYGRPSESDAEGIYRSTDGGETWVCINTDKLYGGTGNGNFLVGDMNEFGTVYMSTVGCGIIYGKIASTEPTEPTVSTAEETSAGTTASDILWGDANCDEEVTIADAVLIMSYAANSSNYTITAQGELNSDVYANGDGINNQDALAVQKYISGSLTELPESYS